MISSAERCVSGSSGADVETGIGVVEPDACGEGDGREERGMPRISASAAGDEDANRLE